jgi:hypothetical protein
MNPMEQSSEGSPRRLCLAGICCADENLTLVPSVGAFDSHFMEHEEAPSKLRDVLSAIEPLRNGLGGDFVRHRALQKSRSIAAGHYKREDDSDDDEPVLRSPAIAEGDEEDDVHADYPTMEQIAAGLAEDENPLVAWTFNGVTNDGGVILDFMSPHSTVESKGLSSPFECFEKMYDEMMANKGNQEKVVAAATLASAAAATVTDEQGSKPPPLLTVPEVDMAVMEADLKTFNATVGRAIKAELKHALKGPSVPQVPPYPSTPVTPAADPSDPQALQRTVSEFNDVEEEELAKQIRIDFLQGHVKPLNLILMIVGTRGDVQPFVGIALKLKEFGHRVRIATHKVFREFVTSFGLEFYPLGGDPKVLSEFVVKHRGIWPGLDISGVIEQKAQMKEVVNSVFPACTEPDPEGGENGAPGQAFIAEAIVANPAAYGANLCAEKLGVPFHVVL